MATLNVRGQEALIQFFRDGTKMGQSWAQMESFEWNPDAEIRKVPILGEPVDERDIVANGYDGTFVLYEEVGKHTPSEIWADIAAREENQTAHPDWTIVIVIRGRSASRPSKRITIQKVVVKMDGESISGKSEYIKSTWSWSSKKLLIRDR
jgi:hypothetical protein